MTKKQKSSFNEKSSNLFQLLRSPTSLIIIISIFLTSAVLYESRVAHTYAASMASSANTMVYECNQPISSATSSYAADVREMQFREECMALLSLCCVLIVRCLPYIVSMFSSLFENISLKRVHLAAYILVKYMCNSVSASIVFIKSTKFQLTAVKVYQWLGVVLLIVAMIKHSQFFIEAIFAIAAIAGLHLGLYKVLNKKGNDD